MHYAERFAGYEYADHLLYKDLAAREHDPHNRDMLKKLSEQEFGHYLFWKKLAPADYAPQVTGWFLLRFRLMRKFLGLTFTVKFLERHERAVSDAYHGVVASMSGKDLEELHRIIADEKEHELYFIGQIKEDVIKYLGFIALGLADAIVEITGVHAGFLGVTSSTLFAGISGLIVGFAAAISMASAAYLQAKQDPDRSAFVSAVMTGISYILSVVGLAIPYFFTGDMGLAFALSIGVGVTLVAALTFYSSVVFDRKFLREFLETVGLMLGTAGATYILGAILGRAFGIEDLAL